MNQSQAITQEKFVDAETGSYAEAITSNLPKYLYHWINAESLLELDAAMPYGGEWPDFPFMKRTSVGQNFPAIHRTRGIFAWINPATAARGGRGENYGNVLVRFEIDARNAIGLHPKPNPFYQVTFSGDLPLHQYDLVRNFGLAEWMILNKAIIKSFTADPEVLRPEVERELKNLKDLSFKYPADQLHFGRFDGSEEEKGISDDRAYAILKLNAFLERGRKFIPRNFLRNNRGKVLFRQATYEDANRIKKAQDFERLYERKVLIQTDLNVERKREVRGELAQQYQNAASLLSKRFELAQLDVTQAGRFISIQAYYSRYIDPFANLAFEAAKYSIRRHPTDVEMRSFFEMATDQAIPLLMITQKFIELFAPTTEVSNGLLKKSRLGNRVDAPMATITRSCQSIFWTN